MLAGEKYTNKMKIELMLEKNPDNIPVMIVKDTRSKLIEPRKNVISFPRKSTVGSFVNMLRHKIYVNPEQSVFIFVGGALLNSSQTIGSIYDKFRDDIGLLTVTYCEENTFG